MAFSRPQIKHEEAEREHGLEQNSFHIALPGHLPYRVNCYVILIHEPDRKEYSSPNYGNYSSRCAAPQWQADLGVSQRQCDEHSPETGKPSSWMVVKRAETPSGGEQDNGDLLRFHLASMVVSFASGAFDSYGGVVQWYTTKCLPWPWAMIHDVLSLITLCLSFIKLSFRFRTLSFCIAFFHNVRLQVQKRKFESPWRQSEITSSVLSMFFE